MGDFYCPVYGPVLLDKSLSANAKLLHGMIAGLEKQEGYAWAQNAYFANVLNVKPDYVSQLVRQLRDKGYIEAKIHRDHSGTRRELRTTPRSRSFTPELSPETTDECSSQPASGPPAPSKTAPAKDSVPPRGMSQSMVIYNDDQLNHKQQEEDVSDGSAEAARPSDAITLVVPVPGRGSKLFDHESGPYLLADTLLTLVEKGPHPKTYAKSTRTPEGREATVQKMACDFDLLLTADGRPIEEVIDLLGWSQRDPFWKGVILSAEKFGKHYRQMLEQMKQNGYGTPPVPDDPNPELTEELLMVFRKLSSNPDFEPNDVNRTKLIEAAAKCEKFFQRRSLYPRNTWANLLQRCIEKYIRDRGRFVCVGHLNSDVTWDRFMPRYLDESEVE